MFMVSTFATVYYQYVILSILHKEYYKTSDSKTRAHGIFNPIYNIHATWDLANLLSFYLLQYKYTFGNLNFRFFLRCRICGKQQNKKAIQLLAHLSKILTCNLQPAVYTVSYTDPPNNSRMKNSRDLTLGEVVYIFIIYHIPYS